MFLLKSRTISICYVTLLLFVVTVINYQLNLIGYLGKRLIGEFDDPLPTLNISSDHVPIVIVDEHQEVIPYWYKAVDEELVKSTGNTLIHIDAHSDMATPFEYDKIMLLKRGKPFRQRTFLPLMYSNDMFIVSAIMKKLIKTVIWVVPNWSTRQKKLEIFDEYVGVTIRMDDGHFTVCSCEKKLHPDPKSQFECYYVDRSVNESDIDIPESTCRSISKFKSIYLSEDVFEDVMNSRLHLLQNVILDIDEDYFGVESGVQHFIDIGVSEETQDTIDQALASLYCPSSVVTEQIIDRELKSLFQSIAKQKRQNDSDMLDGIASLEKQLFKLTNEFFCNSAISKSVLIEELLTYIVSLDQKEIETLARLRYCLLLSPRLTMLPVSFGVCHGNIFPGDKLNEIHVGKINEIKVRSERLVRILGFITGHTELKLVTIARSLRDGYTPRSQQRLIEKELLQSLEKVLVKIKKLPRVLYDKHLVLGNYGWQYG